MQRLYQMYFNCHNKSFDNGQEPALKFTKIHLFIDESYYQTNSVLVRHWDFLVNYHVRLSRYHNDMDAWWITLFCVSSATTELFTMHHLWIIQYRSHYIIVIQFQTFQLVTLKFTYVCTIGTNCRFECLQTISPKTLTVYSIFWKYV